MTRLAILLVISSAAFGQKFEAADVHVSPHPPNPSNAHSNGVLRGERYDLRHATMLDLIAKAWDIDPDAVIGGPNWLEFDSFDIAGKAPAHTPPPTIRLMLQNLLKDRFDLVVHQGTRPMPAYALSISRNGKPKLRDSSEEGGSGCRYLPWEPPALANIACRKMTMSAFAQWLSGGAGGYLHAPVFDATGLEGSWDFDLKWNQRWETGLAGTQRLTVFEALEKQVGLTLTFATAPSPVLVIDSVDQRPTPSLPGIESLLPPRVLEFEVADLKPSRQDEKEVDKFLPGGGLELRAWDLKRLIAFGFDIPGYVGELAAGIPRWAESARFDLNAKPPVDVFGPVNFLWANDDIRLMTRNLLIERFRMKTHYEDRPISAYSLVAEKPKMKKADPSHRSSCREARFLPNDPREANPMLSSVLTCENVTMSQFASKLFVLAFDYFPVPVEDATELNGAFDFTVTFTWKSVLDQQQQAGQKSGANGPSASDPTGGISIFDAVSKQLGLKLEKRKRMLPILVIDHIEQKPLEN